MSTPLAIRAYDYIDRPYEAVKTVMRERVITTLQRATTSAATRAHGLAATLSIGTHGLNVGIDVQVKITQIREDPPIGGLGPMTVIGLEWEAKEMRDVFPRMRAELSIFAVGTGETELLLEGEYLPPLGVVGHLVDLAVGRRVADAAIHRFLRDCVAELRAELAPKRADAAPMTTTS